MQSQKLPSAYEKANQLLKDANAEFRQRLATRLVL